MIRLFTTLYPEKVKSRFAEYAECLRRNLSCDEIGQLCILLEGEGVEPPHSSKIIVRRIGTRPTYADFFAWINEVATDQDVSVVANTDIWFDGSIGAAARVLGGRECLALSRWDGDVLYDHNDSQDCWVFRGPVCGVRGDFPLGIARCDNRILYELQTAGYRVSNPAFSVRVHHLHSGVRIPYPGEALPHYVPPPYRYLWPHNLLGPFGTLWNNRRFPNQKLGWRFDRRRAMRSLPVRIVRKLTCVFRSTKEANAPVPNHPR